MPSVSALFLCLNRSGSLLATGVHLSDSPLQLSKGMLSEVFCSGNFALPTHAGLLGSCVASIGSNRRSVKRRNAGIRRIERALERTIDLFRFIQA